MCNVSSPTDGQSKTSGADHRGTFEERLTQMLRLGTGHFAAFFRALESASQAKPWRMRPGESSSPRRSGTNPFPMLLPSFPEKNGSNGRFRSRCRGWRRALKLTRVLLALFSFWETGCPHEDEQIAAAIEKCTSQSISNVAERYACNLCQDVSGFVRASNGSPLLSRGTRKLDDVIKLLSSSGFSGDAYDVDRLAMGAKYVTADRISLPSKAGTVDPAHILKGERKAIFENLHKEVPLCNKPVSTVKPCYLVSEDQKLAVNYRLLRTEMATLIPYESALLDSHGNVIFGGLFCVDHKLDFDRLIFDRRPQNMFERRLGWARLPHGTLLTQLLVPTGQSVRGSGDDLSNFFYSLKHIDPWLVRNVVGDGTPLNGSDYLEFGACASRKYLLAFRIIGMGDANAVDLAQATHEQVLIDCGCMADPNLVRYGFPVPSPNETTWEGLYIDDHVVIQIVDTQAGGRKRRNNKQLKDETLLEASRKHYEVVGLPRALSKAFDKSFRFVAWGTEVNSHSGRVGVPNEKLASIADLTLDFLDLPGVTKKSLQQLQGQFIHPFMHFSQLMCVFSGVFRFTHKLGQRQIVQVPAVIEEEFLCAAALLSVASSNIRWEVSTRISATDATTSHAGGAATSTTTSIAQTLYRVSIHKGEYVRLDWNDKEVVPPPTDMICAQPAIQELILAHKWTASRSYGFGRVSHINIQEARALKSEVVHLCTKVVIPQRAVNLIDSRVCAGAWAKGRSSSIHLNSVLRPCVGHLVCGRKRLSNVWTDTHHNPSDHPSRKRKIPEPSPAPEWLSGICRDLLAQQVPGGLLHLCGDKTRKDNLRSCSALREHTPHQHDSLEQYSLHSGSQSRCFKELFSGCGNATKIFRESKRWLVSSPLEAYPCGKYCALGDMLNNHTFCALKREAKTAFNTHWHFGIPCGSFCLMSNNLNSGTRSVWCPEGLGLLEREITGNELLRRSVILIRMLIRGQRNNTFTIENPVTSYLFKMPSITRLIQRKEVESVIFDQCEYGLHFPGTPKDHLVKKPTRFIGNLPLSSLARRCGGGHVHLHAIGGLKTKSGWKKRSELAGRYPRKLCLALEGAALAFHQ